MKMTSNCLECADDASMTLTLRIFPQQGNDMQNLKRAKEASPTGGIYYNFRIASKKYS